MRVREASNVGTLRHKRLRVCGLSARATRGILDFDGRSFPCALGRGGLRALKREGDGATPLGRWELLHVFYRAKQGVRPRTRLPVSVIGRDDGWCDAPLDRNYNRLVKLPYPASTESLWRADGLYDVVVVLSHNARPRVRGCGSAIFMHVARPGLPPTEGCIALRLRDLQSVLARITRGTTMDVRSCARRRGRN